ncbi:MAG: hypothetical protein PF440_05860 [Thiomicrorhabdus sp.]|jgi:hypothetical protein|nr:hypothetical protein [Thiomicrorhabdus sp.]
MADDILIEDDLKITDENDETDETEDEELEEDETESKTGDDDKPTSGDDTATLQQKLDTLENENKGLIKSLTAQRGQRQELQNDLASIKEAIAEARAEATTEGEVDKLDDTLSKIPVDFDVDGNMSIDPKYLQTKGNPDISALQDEIAALKGTVNAQTTATQEQEGLNTLLREKDGYPEAHKSVSDAWSYLKNDLFDAYLNKKGLAAPQSSDQAIDMIIDSQELTESFAKKYPTLDLESVVEAHLIGTPRYMRKALDKAIVKPNESKHETLDFGKPSSLASANSGGSDSPESLLDRVANMDTEDYENLPPATLAKIDKLLEKSG